MPDTTRGNKVLYFQTLHLLYLFTEMMYIKIVLLFS